MDAPPDPSLLPLIDGVQGTVAFTEGSLATLAGFGMTSNAVRAGAAHLMRVDVALAPRALCEQQNPLAALRHHLDFANVLCTGGPSGKDSCVGDSGGPIIYRNASGTPWLIGVLSKGSELPSEAAPPPQHSGSCTVPLKRAPSCPCRVSAPRASCCDSDGSPAPARPAHATPARSPTSS
jgi:hypothetical protein